MALDGIPAAMVAFIGLAVCAGLAVIAALATGRFRPWALYTRAEWKVVAQLAAIFVMVVAIIYVQNAARYASVDFIYGRF